MKPYYKTDLTTIYNGDCLNVMDKLIEDGVKVDAIITSPPYNIKDFHSNNLKFDNYNGNNMNEKTYQEWQVKVINKAYELLSDNGIMFYNHKNRIRNGILISPYEWLYKTNFNIKQEITWWQRKGANVDKSRFFPFSEKIYWLSKNKDVKLFNRECTQDVINIVPKGKRKNNSHPAVMPEELVETLLLTIQKKPKLVLDMFGGSMTTSFVCESNNINSISIELEEKYCKVGKDRLSSLQMRLDI